MAFVVVVPEGGGGVGGGGVVGCSVYRVVRVGCCWEVVGAEAYWSEVDAAAAPQFLRAYRK